MTEAYTRYLEEKLIKAESAANYAIKRLHEIVLKYDLPFVSDEMREILADINRVKNVIDGQIHSNNDTVN